MTDGSAESDYQSKLSAESKKWGEHLSVEASGEWHAWLDHPLIAEHYRRRAFIDGLSWDQWIVKRLGGPAARSLDLGCGAGGRSVSVFKAGASKYVEGLDASQERIAEAQRIQRELGIQGAFRVADTNFIELPANSYDLIFSCHSFHHFLELEHIMQQAHDALTPRGFFVLEEFVGPTLFQWTDQQIDVVRSLTALIPERLRMFRWGAVKAFEGRPTPAEVTAVSPFESIRSAEIFPLFNRHFQVIAIKLIGGTLQHLLYNGIIHNFRSDDQEALAYLRGVWEVEDALIDSGLLTSDFMLLVGRKKDSLLA